MNKTCTKCGEEKDVKHFPKDKTRIWNDGYDYCCKLCKNKKVKTGYEDEANKLLQQQRSRAWNENPKNREKRLQHRKNYYNKRRLNPTKKLASNLSSYLCTCLVREGNQSWKKKTLKTIGLESWDDFRKHIESTWLPGMNWDNWGLSSDNKTWHIDHIKPVNGATTEEEIKQLFHYSNLRALWGSDNIRKRDN